LIYDVKLWQTRSPEAHENTARRCSNNEYTATVAIRFIDGLTDNKRYILSIWGDANALDISDSE